MTLLQLLSLDIPLFSRLSLLPLFTNTLPSHSVSEVTTLWRCTNLVIIIVIFKAHQHKAAGRKTRLLCYHGVVEIDRISSLQYHGKALLLLVLLWCPIESKKLQEHLTTEKLKPTTVSCRLRAGVRLSEME